MNDDPRETFQADQQAAEAEAASRDQQGWEMHVRLNAADEATKLGYAAHLQAKAAFWQALANLLSVAWGVAVTTGLIVLAYVVAGWFK